MIQDEWLTRIEVAQRAKLPPATLAQWGRAKEKAPSTRSSADTSDTDSAT